MMQLLFPLYNLSEEFVGFDVAAMWDDTKLGLKHLGGWERQTVVTNIEWLRAAIQLFRLVMNFCGVSYKFKYAFAA